MPSMFRRIGGALAIVAILSGTAWGQARRRGVVAPVVASVMPPGGQVGTSVEWRFRGRGFSKIGGVLVSGAGVKVEEFRPEGDTEAVASVRIAPGAAPGYREIRLEGPDGVSNLALVRIDTIPQSLEVEPNETLAEAQKVAVPSCVAGTVRSTDLDHYRIEGKPGQEITLDLEARRVGTSISPVLTVMNARGSALAQARESRSSDHDGRLAVKIPKDGVLIVQVRDNTYGGSESATYRLRVTTTPYATGMYPLGGERGKPLTITAMGGSLKKPLTKTITLPDEAGATIDPGPFESAEGAVEAPMKVVVGDSGELSVADPGRPGAEIRYVKDFEKWRGFRSRAELMRALAASITKPMSNGQTANGLIDHRGLVDRYVMTVKKGEKFRVRVVAEPLGSWLDSVVTIRDAKGEVLAENDDSSVTNESPNRRGVNFLGIAQGTADSLVDFEAKEDGPITIEVTDRYGDGGPEYAYRLSVGASRPDFELVVLTNANAQAMNAVSSGTMAVTPGLLGVYNLAPGMKVPVNFLVIPQGRPGPVTVRVEGLPSGVTAAAVKVEILGPGPKGGSSGIVNPPSKAENVVLDVASYASPGLAEVRFVATAEPEPGKTITRVGTSTVTLGSGVAITGARALTRKVDRFPLRIIGDARPGFVGPPEEPRLKEVKVPGVLLQGDRIELGLEFDQSPLPDPGFKFEARAGGVGLATNTVIATGASLPDSDEEPRADVLVRVLASAKAVPGVYPVTISHAMTGGTPHVTDLAVIVRPPVALLNRAEPIALKPGGKAELWVAVRREVGCLEEVEVRVEGLPRGVKLAGPLTLREGETEGLVTLEMAPAAAPLAKPTAARVVANVRMPRGVVAVESGNRPMIVAGKAE